jgi:hypothetical protein
MFCVRATFLQDESPSRALDLTTSSAGTRPRSFTSMPCALAYGYRSRSRRGTHLNPPAGCFPLRVCLSQARIITLTQAAPRPISASAALTRLASSTGVSSRSGK